MAITCDQTLLPPSDGSFVVVADTHYFADADRADADAIAEFPSRGVQGERAAAVWETIADLDPAFVVHMGDLVQEYPGRSDFHEAQEEALAQIEAVGLRSRMHFVAGNHDVGDKPDPTMPTHAAGDADLKDHQTRFGDSYEQWSFGGFRFLTINSQILNTPLAAATRQREWLNQQLASHDQQVGDENLVVFLHLPLYLRDAADPHLGHYDTVAEPDRGWLLRRLQQARLRHLFAAHVHFRFYDQLPSAAGSAESWICASSSFTRPGFGQLFAAGPAPERGRNDVPKLGFYHCRIRQGNIDIHFVPTGDGRARHRRVLTPVTARQPRLGVTLTHPLVTESQVPLAYPSLVRQPVRNDYPLLLIREMGTGCLRVPGSDLDDPLQQSRLAWLRRAGCHLQATALGIGAALRVAGDHANRFDRLEVQLADGPTPTPRQLSQLADVACPLALCAIVPGDRVGGKQHPRTRIGYRVEEIQPLSQRLADLGLAGQDLAFVVCAQSHQPLSPMSLHRPDTDFALQLRLALDDEPSAPQAVVRGLVLSAAWNAPVFLEPLIDLDRTMDAASGLLDPLCNPGRAYETARLLSALLEQVAPTTVCVDATECYDLVGPGGHLRIWPSAPVASAALAATAAPGRWVNLSLGAVAEPEEPLEDATGPVAWWHSTLPL